MKLDFAICLLILVLACAASRSAAEEDILANAGVKDRLVVHLGCGLGERTAALRANDSYLVQGLDADAENVAKARKHIKQLGLYGKVSVDQLVGDRLHYIDNTVNLAAGPLCRTDTTPTRPPVPCPQLGPDAVALRRSARADTPATSGEVPVEVG